jgi:hypothetical protein
MSRLAYGAAALYVALLLVLAGVGAVAQVRFDRQVELLDAKQRGLIEVASRRADAAAVNGPLAITTWARAAGMVPAPEAADVVAVAPGLPPPAPTPPATSALEVRTVWR